jgi:hypothetical protein
VLRRPVGSEREAMIERLAKPCRKACKASTSWSSDPGLRNPITGIVALLRARRKRPSRRSATKRGDELPPPHACPQGPERTIVPVQVALLEGVSPAVPAPSADSPLITPLQAARRVAANRRSGPKAAICTVARRVLYSITSSARASSEGGTSMLSAFAVLRLITVRI